MIESVVAPRKKLYGLGVKTARLLALALLVACGGGAGPQRAPAPVPDAAPAAPVAAPAIPAEWPHRAEAVEPAAGAHGMVVSDEPLAADVGLAVLRAGGNAVDAAVATAFALAVVYPEAGNLGGGGFAVVRTAGGETAALDFREAAPAAATADMYAKAPEGSSLVGHLSVGVPGAVAGLWELHRKYGTRPWPELLAPAIRLAEEGFVVNRVMAATLADKAAILQRFPASAKLFLPGGEPLAEGTRLANPDLAATLRRIAGAGPDGFYRGKTADLIVAEMKRGKGLVTHADLSAYRAKWREPITFAYRGHTVVAMPPPSSGGVTLAIAAGILDGFDLRALGWHTPAAMHLFAEAMRRAFADRNEHLGDPDFVDVPVAKLLAPARIAGLRGGITPDRATPSAQLAAAPLEGQQTTHVGVVDAQGNAVALTTTINDLFGSGVTVAGAGFLLNDEMDDFTTRPGQPNLFGLVQGAGNAIAPGKRMLSSMSPTIVVDPAGQVLAVIGARGGSRIITAVFQVLSNVVDYGMAVDDAVYAPRLHHQHLPDEIFHEAHGLEAAQVTALEALGHVVKTRAGMTVGAAPSIVRRADGSWTGVGDPRRQGVARAY